MLKYYLSLREHDLRETENLRFPPHQSQEKNESSQCLIRLVDTQKRPLPDFKSAFYAQISSNFESP